MQEYLEILDLQGFEVIRASRKDIITYRRMMYLKKWCSTLAGT